MIHARLFTWIGLAVCGWAGYVCGGEVPQAAIPHTDAAPSIDGVLAPGEWEHAAVLRQIRPLGGAGVPAQPTEFLVQYDAENLYVAAIAHETDSAYPEAYSRPWHDLFFNNDDTVAVVLGVADPEIAERGKVNVGGYAGALNNDFTAADFYYTFLVNAVNARQRQFNEAPLEKAGFTSAVVDIPNQSWVAELQIPFATCGLDPAKTPKFYANCFRFRPPQMSGWHLPGFGGYAPMPLGEFTLLPPGEAGTQEEFPAAEIVQPTGQCEVRLSYGPLNRMIAAEVVADGDPGDVTGILEVEGFAPVEERLAFITALDRDRNPLPRRRAVVLQPLPDGDQPARTAKFTLKSAQGVVLATQTLDCPAVADPEWLGTQAGSEYVDEKIPSPWLMPVIRGSAVRLADKELEFAANALPRAVRRDGARHDLLGGEPTIRIARGGESVALHAAGDAQLQADGTQVRIAGHLTGPGLQVEARARLDFDGFIEYKFQLQAADLSSLSQVRVEIPLAPGVAKYLLPEPSVQKAGALTGAGYRGMASPIWVGNEEEGVSFNFDTDPFRSVDRRRQIEIRQDVEGDSLILNLVDGAGQLSGGEAIFRFFLQPTPTKPYVGRPVRDWVVWDWEGWSSHHGYPDLSKTAEVRKRVESWAQEEKILTLYCCQGLEETAPEMQRYRSDFELREPWRYYVWQGNNCFATCKRGPEGDFQLAGYERIIRETGIRGLMSDGLSVPWGDANVLHRNGCGQPQLVTLEADTPSAIVKQREFLKRMRGLFDATGEEYCLVAHTGGGIDVNTLSFFDAYFEGEQLMRYRRGYYPSEAMFAIAYSGMPWGWRTIYWPKQLHNYNGLDTALAYSLLFNSEYYTNPNTEPDGIDVRLLQEYGGEGSTFYPFWREQEVVDFESETCHLSLYVRDDRMLAVVSNLGYTPQDYAIDFTDFTADGDWEIADELRGEVLPGARHRETLAPFSCRIIRVKRAANSTAVQPAPSVRQEAPFDVETFAAADWRIVNAATAEIADGQLTLQAAPALGAAEAEFQPRFGRDFFCEMQVKLPERFTFLIGSMTLTYGGGWPGWGWMVEGEADPYGRGWIFQQVPLKKEEFRPLIICVDDGILSVRYDGKLVVRDLAMNLAEGGNAFVIRTWHDDTIVARELHVTSAVPQEKLSGESLHPIQ